MPLAAHPSRAARPRRSYWCDRRMSSPTNIGTATMITHAPSVNLVTPKMSATRADTVAPTPLIATPRPPGLLQPEMPAGHAGLRKREPGEHADGVERDQPVDLGAGDDNEQRSGGGQRQDPVREHQPVAPPGELPGQEVVAGLKVGEPREVGEARVRSKDQDQHCRCLEREEQRPSQWAGAVDDLADLGQNGWDFVLVGNRVHLRREEREPEEHHPKARAHDRQRLAGVQPLRRAKSGHAVGDRLYAGDRRSTRRECMEDDVHGRAHEQTRAGVAELQRPASTATCGRPSVRCLTMPATSSTAILAMKK